MNGEQEIRAEAAMADKFKAQPKTDIDPTPDFEEDKEVLQWAQKEAEAGGYDSVPEMLEDTGFDSAGEKRAMDEMADELDTLAKSATEADLAKASTLQKNLISQLEGKPVAPKVEEPPTAYESAKTEAVEVGEAQELDDMEVEEGPSPTYDSDVTEAVSMKAHDLLSEENATFPGSEERVAVPKQEVKTEPVSASENEDDLEVGKIYTPEGRTEEDIAIGKVKQEKDLRKYVQRSKALLGGSPTKVELPTENELDTGDRGKDIQGREKFATKYEEGMIGLGFARDAANEAGDTRLAQKLEAKRLEFAQNLKDKMGPAAARDSKAPTTEGILAKLRARDAERTPKVARETDRDGRSDTLPPPKIYKRDEQGRMVYQIKNYDGVKVREPVLDETLDYAIARQNAEAVEAGYKNNQEAVKANNVMAEYRNALHIIETGEDPRTGEVYDEAAIESVKQLAERKLKKLDEMFGTRLFDESNPEKPVIIPAYRQDLGMDAKQEEKYMKEGSKKAGAFLEKMKASAADKQRRARFEKENPDQADEEFEYGPASEATEAAIDAEKEAASQAEQQHEKEQADYRERVKARAWMTDDIAVEKLGRQDEELSAEAQAENNKDDQWAKSIRKANKKRKAALQANDMVAYKKYTDERNVLASNPESTVGHIPDKTLQAEEKRLQQQAEDQAAQSSSGAK